MDHWKSYGSDGTDRRRAGPHGKGREYDRPPDPRGRVKAMQSHLAMSSVSLPDVTLLGKEHQGETMGTRIGRLDAVRSGDGQVIERSTGDSKHVIAVGSVSRAHTRRMADSGELTTVDLDRCSGTTLDRSSW